MDECQGQQLMTLEAYQDFVRSRMHYPSGMNYAAMALAGEGGEALEAAMKLAVSTGKVANEQKKVLRDDNQKITEDRRKKLLLELGDAQWYIVACATELGATIHEVMGMNMEKLIARAARGGPVG